MNKKSLSMLLFSFVCLANVIASPATAGIIEADYLAEGDNLAVYDESTGLTWLDFSVFEQIMGYEEASTSFDGYRMATNEEVVELFHNFFGDDAQSTINTIMYYDEELSNRFMNLFGESYADRNFLTSQAFYLDETLTLRIAGIEYELPLEEIGDNEGMYYFYGTEYRGDFSSFYDDGLAYSSYFMVKNTMTKVSEPNTFVLLCMAVAGLFMRGKRL